MIIIKYIDVPNIKYQLIGIIASIIIIAIFKSINKQPKRKEVIKGNEICSMQWLTDEEIKNVLGISISNDNSNKRCETDESK